jgi:hypothetical protein
MNLTQLLLQHTLQQRQVTSKQQRQHSRQPLPWTMGMQPYTNSMHSASWSLASMMTQPKQQLKQQLCALL